MSGQIRVAVIGAGAAGLCALRHLTACPTVFSTRCYEQTLSLGGTWVYTDETSVDHDGYPVISSMYKHLRTNLPKEVMAFPDLPFQENLPSFIHHSDMLSYLNDYCDHFKLRDFIEFGTRVIEVRAKECEGRQLWDVTTQPTISSEATRKCQEFDGVIVCNGHYSKPFHPNIDGVGDFRGFQMHSHYYKVPERFVGMRVLCLGANASGRDIALELCGQASHVYISHNMSRIVATLPVNVTQKVGLKRLHQHSAVFLDDSEADIDAILYCTGYKYDFPFLSENCRLFIEDERVHNLYKHLIYTKRPSLSFVGIPKSIIPFVVFECQIRYIVATLDGSLQLPSEKGMEEVIEEDFRTRVEKYGLSSRKAHTMVGKLQWEYISGICGALGIDDVAKNVSMLYDHCVFLRCRKLTTYKIYNFRVTGQDSFEELDCKG